MNRETLYNCLVNRIKNLTLSELVGEFITETQAIEEFYNLCNGRSAGKSISLLFNPHRLATRTNTNTPSVFESLSCENTLQGMARLYIYTLDQGQKNAFLTTVRRGYNGVQYVHEFPPYVARTIYQQFCNYDNIRIFDPCCGWGGRMIGAASLPNVTYEGCEPATQTFNGLIELSKWLNTLQPSFSATIHNIPFEDFSTDKKFNIALTSPPYYDTEVYSDESTNSLNRYKSFNDWVLGFYKPLILNTVNLLYDDGVFIINVGDRQYPLSDELFKICSENNLQCVRIHDYLSGHGEGKEKFYCVSKNVVVHTQGALF